MGVALVASAAIEQKQVEPKAESKVVEAAADATAATTGEKKHGKRGLFDFGYGFGGFDPYGWASPPLVVEKPYPVRVHVPVEKHVPVFIDRKVPVVIEKHVPIHIDRPVPYPVKVPVKVPVVHKVPYPVAVPVSHDAFGFGGHHFSNGWVGHHGFGSHSYSGFQLHH